MLATVQDHRHIALIYETEEDWEQAAIPFLAEGLSDGEKCMYITDSRSSGEVCSLMRQKGFDLPALMSTEQLVMVNQSDVYTQAGCFDPDRMLGILDTATKKAIEQGFRGLRATGEMSWALRGCKGSERLMEYESGINAVLSPKFPFKTICQYDMRKFGGGALKSVILTHPFIIWKGRLLANSYYIPPETYLTENRENLELRNWMEHLHSAAKHSEELSAARN